MYGDMVPATEDGIIGWVSQIDFYCYGKDHDQEQHGEARVYWAYIAHVTVH